MMITSLMNLPSRWWQRLFSEDLSGLTTPIVVEESRLPWLVRLTIAALSMGTAIFLLWAGLTPIREIARSEGQVVPASYNRLVQHLDGGLIREIVIQEGDFVQAGQTLIKVDGVGTEEDLNQQQALVVGLSLQIERLRAFVEDREPDFSKITTDKAQIAEQQHIYSAAKLSRERERNVLQEQIAQKQSAQSRLQGSIATAQSSLSIATEGLGIYTTLMEKGLTNRSNFLRRKEEYNQRKGEVNELKAQLSASAREQQEYSQRLEALIAQQRSTSYDELHSLETELAQQTQGLNKQEQRVGRLDVKAPVMGYVKGLRVNTIGAVIPAGQTLMEIVPVDDQLVVEVHISPREIGRVAVGQPAEVKIDSYDYVRFGTLRGTLQSISAMTFTDELQREDYYKGRILLPSTHLGSMPGQHMILPGMTVNADIVTGEKTILNYLLRPIRTAMQNALTEQ